MPKRIATPIANGLIIQLGNDRMVSISSSIMLRAKRVRINGSTDVTIENGKLKKKLFSIFYL